MNNKRIIILTLFKHLLCAKYFKHIIVLTLGQFHAVGVITPILQLSELRLREFVYLLPTEW